MAKISRHGGASLGIPSIPEAPSQALVVAFSGTDDEEPSVYEVREHPGTGLVGEGVEATADGTEHTLVVEYETWLISELRDECARRGLVKSGNKDELVARLVAADEAVPDPEG